MRLIFLTIAVLMSCVISADAGLLTNGGFESPAGEGLSSVDDWDFSGDGGLRTETPDQFEGDQFVRFGFNSTFNGGQSVLFQQDFSVATPGNYDLSFAFQLRETFCGCDDLFGNTVFDVLLDGTSLTDGDLADPTDYAPGNINSGWSSSRWDVETIPLSLSGGNHTLDFSFSRDSSLFGRNYQLGLDGAQLSSTGTSPVPEPASITLLMTGALGLCGVRLRRRWRGESETS